MESIKPAAVLPVQENVVPAYPYDDALYSLFHNSIVGPDGKVARAGGRQITYNQNLFAEDVKVLHGRAAAVACLFENIILAPRPLELPDMDTYTKDNGYTHPDLRLQMPSDAPPQFGKYVGWMDFGNDEGEQYSEWDHLEGLAIELRTKLPFKAFFKRHGKLFADINPSYPGIAFSDMILNTVAEAHLAAKNNAVLLGNDVFHELYHLLLTEAPANMELFSPEDMASIKVQQFDLADVEVLSLSIPSTTIDKFAAVRMNKEIQNYGRNWRRIISTSAPDELLEKLLAEMAEAYHRGSIAEKVEGFLSMIGTFLTWFGGMNLHLDAAGMGVDLLDKVAGKVAKRQGWRLIGPKMQEVALDAKLAKVFSDKKQSNAKT